MEFRTGEGGGGEDSLLRYNPAKDPIYEHMRRAQSANLNLKAQQRAESRRTADATERAAEAIQVMRDLAVEQHRENQQLRLLTAVLSVAVLIDMGIAMQSDGLAAWRVAATFLGAFAAYGLFRLISAVWAKWRDRRAER
ncbi:hypothetical protein D9V41_09165 [Aeromicrobium phragmitis]|uniref:Uncharacterized protein n=1 Tax=Aeromicrobium phragmitis TaxID=2478914 RepID=A0A3L8PL14_9ACTN|nr:hypothetical protein [Aeromicrobium phragmitis]RLV56047.1 hypothetical protein D9V41_09165 [Aeromicrobium phragmitis]